MPYNVLASSKTPALIIYILDVSASMSQPLGNKKRIDVVMDALQATLERMVFLSTKGGKVSPRYRIAMFAYSDHVYDLLDGIKTLDQVAQLGVPELSTMRSTDTARAFSTVEKILQQELPNIETCPAPLICHMTDGEFTGADPEPIVRRIMQLKNQDGYILLENIYISDKLLTENVSDVQNWSGILTSTKLTNQYAQKLRNISSPLPDSYRIMMLENGYQMSPGALMMLPGLSPELVEMGFVMSMATPVSR
jgi:hypothetical protein